MISLSPMERLKLERMGLITKSAPVGINEDAKSRVFSDGVAPYGFVRYNGTFRKKSWLRKQGIKI